VKTPATWNAGHVNRWHTNDDHALRNSQDTNHQHSARVALLLLHLWPDAPREAIIAALHHDLPEKYTGDVSRETKQDDVLLAELLHQADKRWHIEHGTQQCPPEWVSELKLCDVLDAVLWAWSVNPDLMARMDWTECREWCIDEAKDLGVGFAVWRIFN